MGGIRGWLLLARTRLGAFLSAESGHDDAEKRARMWLSWHRWSPRSALLALAVALLVALPGLALLALGDSRRWLSPGPPATAQAPPDAVQQGSEGSGPVLVACAGVEGTGHHMFHEGLFPAFAKALDYAYQDTGMEVKQKQGRKEYHVDGYASQLDHYATRHGTDFLLYPPVARGNISAVRLQDIAQALPEMRVLMVDAPSFPSCTLDLRDQGCETKSSWNNPDFLTMERGALGARPAWRLRTLVLVRSWPELLASTLDRGITGGGLPLELRFQANMLHTAMIVLNAQVAALRTPWAVLEYERMVRNPRGCGRGLADFVGLPGDVGERVAAQVIRQPSAKGAEKWSAQELNWIRETFESEEATLLWPTLHRGRRDRAIC